MKRPDGPALVEDDSFDYPVWRTSDVRNGATAAIEAFAARCRRRARGWTGDARFHPRRAARRARDVPTALYFRDVEGVQLLNDRSVQPNMVFTNVARITELVVAKGWDAPTIPSVVETASYMTQSTRQVVLFINPRSQRKGVDIAWALARARPDVPFVFLEAWRFTPEIRAELERRAGETGNVEVRPSVRELDRIYADARVLFAPYEDSRPRVVAEAQANGIPVLGARVPALVEAVGPGGLLVDVDVPIDEWAMALATLWDDVVAYARYCDAGAGTCAATRDAARIPRRGVRSRTSSVAPAHLTRRAASPIASAPVRSGTDGRRTEPVQHRPNTNHTRTTRN